MDSSELTRRRQARLLYANYITERTRADGGCSVPPRFLNGGIYTAQSFTETIEGSVFTTTEQYNAVLAAASCQPVSTGDGVYIVGQFQNDPISFYGAQAPVVVDVHTVNNSDNWASFLVKYSWDGTPVWSARVGAIVADQSGTPAGTDYPSICVSADGSIYVFGHAWFDGTTNNYIYAYNTAASSPTVSMPVLNVNRAEWLVKYNANGQIQWATFMSYHVTNNDFLPRPFIVSDANNNVYVQLNKADNNMYVYDAGNTQTSSAALVNVSNSDVFIVKYDNAGQFQWYSVLSSTANDNAAAMTCDAQNNLYVGISRYNQTSLAIYTNSNMSAPNFTLAGGDSGNWYYSIMKYNAQTGNISWATNIRGVANSNPFNMSTDFSSNLYVAVSYSASQLAIYSQNNQNTPAFTVPVRTQSQEIALVKYNSDGIAQWVSTIVGTNNEQQPLVAVNSDNEIIVVGQSYSDAIDIYDSGSAYVNRTLHFGLSDAKVFIVKFAPSGTSQWASYIGSFSYGDIRCDMKVNTNNYIVITGMLSPISVNFYNTTGSSVLSLQNQTQNDVCFLVAYNTAGTPVWRTYGTGQAQPQLAI
jgi:hypothetical protein